MNKKIEGIFKGIVIVLILGLVLVSLFGIRIVYAQAGQTTLRPTDDTYVDSNNPTSNYGGQDYLSIVDYTTFSTGMEIVLLKFNFSSIPDGAVIDGATLSLYASLVIWTDSFQYNIQACFCSNNSWTESSLTYDNMPNYNTTSMDSVLVASAGQWYNWTVVDAVGNALSSNPKSVTIVMQEPNPPSSGSIIQFDSKESPVYPDLGIDRRPELTIHWSSVLPEFPTSLILPLFILATILGVIVYKKKDVKTRQS